MNFSTLSYLIVALATLIFCTVLLVFVHDSGIPYFATAMAGLVIGHWFGYSGSLTSSQPVAAAPITQPVVTEAPKTP
jgi:hypothetical protein